jgi:hypothetical protein
MPASTRANLLLRSGLCACSRGSPFCGLFFALIADGRLVLVSEPIRRFLVRRLRCSPIGSFGV